MPCPACGRPSDPSARFCVHCGARIVSPAGAGAEINVMQSISASSEGTGVSVGEIAGNVTMNIVQFQLPDDIADAIRAVPTELQPSSNIASGAKPTHRDAVKTNIQRILEAAARGDARAIRIRVGDDEVSRVDMLLKQAVLLETEAGQMFLDSLDRNRDAVERAKARSPGPTFELDLADILSGFDGAGYERKLRDALSLLEEANRLDPANTEVLVHLAGVLSQLNPDDDSQPRRLLLRVQHLLENPKHDAEKFRLAQATYLLATSGPHKHEESLIQARTMFQQLGRTSWVNQCDLQLNSLRGHGATQVAAAPAWSPPAQDPAGSWQVSISDGRVINMFLAPDGRLQASMMVMPGFGYQATGNWQQGHGGSFLDLQGVINGVQPFAVRIVIQNRQPGIFTGVGSDGLFYQFHRIG